MNRYRVVAGTKDEQEVHRDVEAMTVFGAVSLVTVDLWEDSRGLTWITVWELDAA